LRSLPLVILAGSDRRVGSLPPGVQSFHPLGGGYKGLDLRVASRPLIEILLSRVRASRAFDEIYVAGPAQHYAQYLLQAKPVDTDGGLADNVLAAITEVSARHPTSPIAFLACDVLPEPESLAKLIEEYWAVAPCDIWFPVVRMPEDRSRLASSIWKPTYQFVTPDGVTVNTLPGHLGVLDPGALNMPLVKRFIQLAYSTRNQPLASRRFEIVRGVLKVMLSEDFRELFQGYRPSLSWAVLGAARAAAKLRRGSLPTQKLSHLMRELFIRPSHRRAYPDRQVHVPIISALSLALDLDTEEEAKAAGVAWVASDNGAKNGNS